ncbi:serine hydrolase [Ekhidna sp.]|uniref:serine hydrolase domain-containing protein n=1 Tax=Ekhidna sp. TaxID=2608089 RepID=UPI0032971E75
MRTLILLSTLSFLLSSNGKAQAPDLPSSTVEEAGFNRDSIDILIDLIYETPHKDFRGLVVIKDNKLVIQEHFNTYMWNTIHDIRSAGKSVTALLLGVAMQEGLIESLDQSVYSLFSEAQNPSINEEYKKIRLRDLLDMSSGLDADSDDWRTPGQASNWISLDNWREYVLNIPLKAKPGENFVYADIHPLLIGLAIEEASGMSLKDYAQKKLFEPLGINQVYWFTNASNQTGAAGNLYLTTLDFAKLGLLVTNEGKWKNQQIIHPDYIESLINTKRPLPESWSGFADAYGMFWYKCTKTFAGKEIDYLFASGFGGNHLVVIPEKEIVIAVTSSAYGAPYSHGRSFAITYKVLNALK